MLRVVLGATPKSGVQAINVECVAPKTATDVFKRAMMVLTIQSASSANGTRHLRHLRAAFAALKGSWAMGGCANMIALGVVVFLATDLITSHSPPQASPLTRHHKHCHAPPRLSRRIFNSWDDAYIIECDYGQHGGNSSGICSVTATGAPFNDAYRRVSRSPILMPGMTG
jgi:hypothetical protein